MKKVALFVCLFTAVISLYAQEGVEKKKDFTKVKSGMSEEQVKKVVGNPEIMEKFKTLQISTTDTTTYWRYENDLTIIFKNHYVEAIERDHNMLLQRIQEWADPKNRSGIKLLYK